MLTVLIAQRNTVSTPRQQLPGTVFATLGVAVIGKAPRQAVKQIECLFNFAQNDGTAVEKFSDLTVEKAGKFKFRWVQCADMDFLLFCGLNSCYCYSLPQKETHSFTIDVELTTGAVEVRNLGISVAGGFCPCQCLNPSQLPVYNSRSSNRACRFPALGFQTNSCLRPRKNLSFRRKSNQTLMFIESLIGKSHILSASTSARLLPSLWYGYAPNSLNLT